MSQNPNQINQSQISFYMLAYMNTIVGGFTTSKLKPVYRSIILGLKAKEEITVMEEASKRLSEYGLPCLEQYYKSQ